MSKVEVTGNLSMDLVEKGRVKEWQHKDKEGNVVKTALKDIPTDWLLRIKNLLLEHPKEKRTKFWLSKVIIELEYRYLYEQSVNIESTVNVEEISLKEEVLEEQKENYY